MRRSRRPVLLLAAAVLLAAAPAQAFRLSFPEMPALPTLPKPAASTIDAVVLRPLGAVQTAVGAVLFVPMALFTAPTGRAGVEEAFEVTVRRPYEDTFVRPLGEF